MPATETIKREIVLDPSVIPALDESILILSENELDFLHTAITPDDEELKRRILDIQKIVYAQHAYPCIRAFHFVNLMMSNNPIYPTVVEAGRLGRKTFLDLGCCMGTDVRKLVADGYPPERVLGSDLRQSFLDAGFDLFQDSQTNRIRFFTSDIFDVQVTPSHADEDSSGALVALAGITNLSQLRGRINHFYLGALFHLFDQATQYALALRVASLLKREPGSIIFGRHQGLDVAGQIDDHLGRDRYAHSPSSWLSLWQDVFTEIETVEFPQTKIVVEAALTPGFDQTIIPTRAPTLMLVWSVRIIE